MCLSRKRLLMPSASTIRSASAKRAFVVDIGLEQQRHAEFAGALLQDQQQRPARAAAKAVAADAVHGAAEMHGNVVPIGEFLGDAAVARRIVFLEIVERRVREHHAEAEGVVGAVALIDRDLGLRPLLFQEDRGIETGRSAADNRDLHLPPPKQAVGLVRNYFKPKTILGQGAKARHAPDASSASGLEDGPRSGSGPGS